MPKKSNICQPDNNDNKEISIYRENLSEVERSESFEEENFIEQFYEEDPLLDTTDEIFLSVLDIFKKISKISVSMGLSFTFSFSLVEMAVMLNLLSSSEDELAATTLIITMINIIIMLGVSPLFSMSNIASGLFGSVKAAKKNKASEGALEQKRIELQTIYRNGILISIPIIPLVISGFVFSKEILVNILGQNEAVAQHAQDFLRPYSWGIIPLFFAFGAEQLILASCHELAAMWMGLTTFSISSGLAVWLGFGGLGITAQGASGVASAFAVESVLKSLLFTGYLWKHESFQDFKFFSLFKNLKGNGQQLQKMLKLGCSFSLTWFAELSLPLATSVFTGLLGTPEQSTWNFAMQLVFFTMITSSAFGQGCSQELGRGLGALHDHLASRIGKYGLMTTMLWVLPIPLILAIFPNILTAVLSSDNDVEAIEAILKGLMPIISLGVISDALRNNLLQQLRYLKDTRFATGISLTSLFLGVIMAGVLGLKTEMGIYGIATGYAGGMSLAAIGLLGRWLQHIQPEQIRESRNKWAVPATAGCFCGFFGKTKNKRALNEQLVSHPQGYQTIFL